MSLIQAAQKYAAMRESGLTSEQTGVDPVAIRDRLQFLLLMPEEQDKLKRNELSYVRALKLCERRQRGEGAAKTKEAFPVVAHEPV